VRQCPFPALVRSTLSCIADVRPHPAAVHHKLHRPVGLRRPGLRPHLRRRRTRAVQRRYEQFRHRARQLHSPPKQLPIRFVQPCVFVHAPVWWSPGMRAACLVRIRHATDRCGCSSGTRATATSTTGTAPAASTSVTTSRRKRLHCLICGTVKDFCGVFGVVACCADNCAAHELGIINEFLTLTCSDSSLPGRRVSGSSGGQCGARCCAAAGLSGELRPAAVCLL
jgi:hypothetical protein